MARLAAATASGPAWRSRRRARRRVGEVRRRHDVGDEAERVGALRADAPPGEDQLLGDGDAGDARQPLGAARARDDPQPHLRQPELGGVGGDAEVAGERQLEPAAERGAVDRRDHRPRERGDGVHQRLSSSRKPQRLLERHRPPLLEIGAGAERLARPGQHDRPQVVAALEAGGQLGEGALERRDQRLRQRVGGVGPVQRHERHAPARARPAPALLQRPSPWACPSTVSRHPDVARERAPMAAR